MPDHDFIGIFISKLNNLNVRYVVTGAVASIIYGEIRLTHDIDLVIELNTSDIERFIAAFPLEAFYCPPPEVIYLEITRPQRGHFNLIHHDTGFKADIYASGQDELHQWALDNRKRVDFGGEELWLAPPEYVILRKLEYYREGGSDKHLRDISGILELSLNQIDIKLLEKKIMDLGLEEEWQRYK
jgi:hypothetical protein